MLDKSTHEHCTCGRKNISTLVDEVFSGLWGSGHVRRERLEAAGYDYSTIQNAVNIKRFGLEDIMITSKKAKKATRSVRLEDRIVDASEGVDILERGECNTTVLSYTYREVELCISRCLVRYVGGYSAYVLLLTAKFRDLAANRREEVILKDYIYLGKYTLGDSELVKQIASNLKIKSEKGINIVEDEIEKAITSFKKERYYA